MKIDARLLDHLHGRVFSNAAAFPLGNRGRAQRRLDRLVDLVRGQRVLHVGCCDHVPNIRGKVDRGIHLHQLLCRSASHCVGVDTSREGVDVLRELGFPAVYVPEEAPGEAYDICLLADVIEHIGDPVAFLRSMRVQRFERLVVVTPNVFRLRNSLPGDELINSDHRYWFSPYTLCKVLADAGYDPVRVELCHGDHIGWRGAALARLVDFMPRYRETLVVEARR
jgi:hypothetical protein